MVSHEFSLKRISKKVKRKTTLIFYKGLNKKYYEKSSILGTIFQVCFLISSTANKNIKLLHNQKKKLKKNSRSALEKNPIMLKKLPKDVIHDPSYEHNMNIIQ